MKQKFSETNGPIGHEKCPKFLTENMIEWKASLKECSCSFIRSTNSTNHIAQFQHIAFKMADVNEVGCEIASVPVSSGGVILLLFSIAIKFAAIPRSVSLACRLTT